MCNEQEEIVEVLERIEDSLERMCALLESIEEGIYQEEYEN